MRSTPCVFGLVCLVGLSACRSEEGRFTILSTKNVELSRIDLKRVSVQRGITASEGRLWFLFIPFGGSPSVLRLSDECLSKGRGDFMVNARLDSFGWTCLLFSWGSLEVTGDVGDSLGVGAREVGHEMLVLPPCARAQEIRGSARPQPNDLPPPATEPAKSREFCATCGARFVPPDAAFCTDCGAKR